MALRCWWDVGERVWLVVLVARLRDHGRVPRPFCSHDRADTGGPSRLRERATSISPEGMERAWFVPRLILPGAPSGNVSEGVLFRRENQDAGHVDGVRFSSWRRSLA